MAKKDKGQVLNISVGICEDKLKSLKVTQRHINESEQGDGHSCAIAYALREALGDDGADADIDVGQGLATFIVSKEIKIPISVCGREQYPIKKSVTIRGELNIGAKANDFIDKFDKDKKLVKPTTFKAKPELEVEVVDALY